MANLILRQPASALQPHQQLVAGGATPHMPLLGFRLKLVQYVDTARLDISLY